MSDIAKKIKYGELENKEYQALFKFTNGETVLGVINYDNGDVYMGEIKPDEKYDGKRDRRRHGYGKVFPKRGKVVDGEWYLGQVIGKSVAFDKKGKRTVEVRGSDPSFRSILYSYYLTDDNKYGGDNYNGLYKDKFWEGDFKDVLRRGELREQLFNGTVQTTAASTSAQKSAPTKEKAPAKKNTVPKEPAVKVKIDRIEFDNGDIYEGEMVNGLRHGKGKYTWANGDFYEGEWAKGWRCGFGIYKSYSKNEKDGSTYTSYTYEGEWKDSKKHGQGIAKKYKIYSLFGTPFLTWSHEGGYANGDMHGHGIYKEWKVPGDTGRVHEGEWVNNKRQGRFVWEYEPSVTGKKYIDFYDQGSSVVFGIDYDPSIKTLEDAKRVKAENDAVRDRVIAERRATEAAQSSSSSDASSDSDNEAVWEEFEYVEDLIEKLKNPELFDDPEDRWIANAYQYFEVFMDDVAANYSDADFATASEIFANILDLDVNGLQNYLTDKLGYIGDHKYVEYIEACLNYACSHVTKDALIPFANLCYFRTQEIGINYMDLYVKAYSRHYIAKGEDILWFERYDCNWDESDPLSDEDDSQGNERGYGDSLSQMLTNGYRMGSDCRLYLPMKPICEELPQIGYNYQMEQILSNVYAVGGWKGFNVDFETWENGSFAMDSYMAWMENEDEHTILLRNDGLTKRTGFRKGDYSKRRVALIPMRNYIHNAMLANVQVRKNVPLAQRLLYQRKLEDIIASAKENMSKGFYLLASDDFKEAFDHGYDPTKLAEICYNGVYDALMKNEDQWFFDDSEVEIMKIAAVCDPESYAYFMSSIAKSFDDYNHKYIYEVLTGEEYPG